MNNEVVENSVNNNFNMPKKKKGLIIVIILLLLIILGLTGYILYDKGIIFNNNTNNNESGNSLDINSELVQNLYDLIKYPYYSTNIKNIFAEGKSMDGVISAEKLSSDDKFRMAIEISKSNKVDCKDLFAEIKKYFDKNYGSSTNYTCDTNYYDVNKKKFVGPDNTDAWATFYSEDEVKNKIYQIFGKDYYTQQEAIRMIGYDYLYIKKINGYIIVNTQTSSISVTYNPTLVSAKKEDNKIILNENATFTNTDNDKVTYDFEYTFTYNENDNSYYFSSLKKTLKD